LTWIGGLLDGARGAALGLGMTVLMLDLALLATLRAFAPPAQRGLITLGYWLSPIVLYIGYWHGQLDVFPVLALSVALFFLKDRRFTAAGLGLGLSIAAKLSMAVALPFMWIYVMTARRLRPMAWRLVRGTIAGLATLAPFALSPGFRQMVLGTPESQKVFAVAVPYDVRLLLYVLPLVFAALVFWAWRIRRFNFEVLFNLTGVAFLVLFLLTPASPGWALWLTPFLVVHLARSSRGAWILAVGFSTLFVLFNLSVSTGATLPWLDLSAPWQLSLRVHPRADNLLLTIYVASGGALTFQMLREGVLRNPFYLATRAPLMIGIAGDSGAGKDTLALALQDLFGARSTAIVSGDDYHIWDRAKPMWRALTHLNPKANNLRRFNEDALSLGKGRPIRSPHYDHRVGRMTKPRLVQPTDVVIAAGLHALHTPGLNAAYDLKVFLGMDEPLRQFFKIRRDVHQRGHSLETVSAAIAARAADSARYILPQAAVADLQLSLSAQSPSELASPTPEARDPGLRLTIEASATQDLTNLARALMAVGGLSVVQDALAGGRPRLIVDGDPSFLDVAAAAGALAPQMFDFLSLEPKWSGGLTGVMQLAVLDQVDQRLAAKRA
jgi:uridine kinase